MVNHLCTQLCIVKLPMLLQNTFFDLPNSSICQWSIQPLQKCIAQLISYRTNSNTIFFGLIDHVIPDCSLLDMLLICPFTTTSSLNTLLFFHSIKFFSMWYIHLFKLAAMPFTVSTEEKSIHALLNQYALLLQSK